MRSFTARRLSAFLLIVSLVLNLVGWTMVVWNVSWLMLLPIVSPGDLDYPILHAIPLLLIGIPLARRAE
jgi:hypothetical protein